MRCFAHILKPVAQAFLYGDDAASFELQSEAYDMLEQVEKDLEHLRAKGLVGKLHNIVKLPCLGRYCGAYRDTIRPKPCYHWFEL